MEALEKYGKTEIAFIMSKNGLKVGHEKEIRYDILARIIPVYEELKKHIKEIPELEKSENINQDLIDLSLYLSNFHNYPESYHRLANLYSERDNIESELKAAKKEKSQAKNRHDFDKVASSVNQLKIKESGIKKEVEKIKNEMKKFEMSKLIDYNIKSLGLTERPEEASAKWRDTGKKLTESEWFKKINLPEFHYPKNISSLSFEMDKGEKKEHIGFREPYSTYKGESKEEIPIEANQVIASTNPLAAAKLLVLSQEKQKEYTNKVLRPLLVNYYLATSENKEEAIKKYREDIKDVKTTSEIIHLIQEKIISPIEKEL